MVKILSNTAIKRIKNQGKLNTECLLAYFWGLEACRDCECYKTLNCGGERILKTLKSAKGFKIPPLKNNKGLKIPL
ncbi:MAG: hypothetical protein FJ150_07910 [Euryarchaeota archaeon]|nr:hypothetical protein [Euryarchaeota archaeon]